MKVDEITGKKTYESFASEIGVNYSKTYSYSNNTWYPLQWKNDNGIDGESNQTQVIEYATENDAKAQESNTLTVTQTYWTLSADEMQANFISANTRDTSKSNSMYYELLCNNGNSNYWLASRYVNIGTSSNAYFGLRRVYSGNVSGKFLVDSSSSTAGDHYYVRPVVTLGTDIEITAVENADGNSTENMHQINKK